MHVLSTPPPSPPPPLVHTQVGAALGAMAGMAMGAMMMGYPKGYQYTHMLWDSSEYGAMNDYQQREMETQMMIGATHTPYGQGKQTRRPRGSGTGGIAAW